MRIIRQQRKPKPVTIINNRSETMSEAYAKEIPNETDQRAYDLMFALGFL